MPTYQVTAIQSEPCPADQRARHITGVELHGADGSHRVETPVLRLMISSGDNIVAPSAKTGSEADVRKGKCVCGVKSVRSTHGTRVDDDLSSLPPYS